MPIARPSHQEIADRAYSRFHARGASDGFDLDDWFQAEQELLEMQAPNDRQNEHDDVEVEPAKHVSLKKPYPRRAAS